MKINRSGSSPTNGFQPQMQEVNSRKQIKEEGFSTILSRPESLPVDIVEKEAEKHAASMSTIRGALYEIVADADLSIDERAATTVRQSARMIIELRLGGKQLKAKEGKRLLEDLSEFVAQDPFLKRKLLSILERIQREP